MKSAVFLDRDGVLVEPVIRDGRPFPPSSVAELRIFADANAALHRLRARGMPLIVVTNQPDVGDGLIAHSEVDAMHEIMARQLPLDAVRACFHGHGQACDCRKPKPGMILQTAMELGINLAKSFMVGDRKSDIEAGRAAGCATVFIDLGYTLPAPDAPDYVVHSIAEAANVIIETVLTTQEGP